MVAAKKPLTPYFRFCQQEREKHAKHSESKLTAKELGEKWRGLSDAAKKPYQDAYQNAKAEYDEEQAEKKENMKKRGRNLSKSKERRDERESSAKPKGKKTNHQKKK